MPAPLEPVLRKLEADLEPAIERLCALLRIPSISTDPAYRDDVQRCAAHVAEDLASIGLDSAVHQTDGHPIVVAHHPGPDGAAVPHLLYYGHYDVQPPDPIDLWESPPFEPSIVEGPHGRRLVARGAVDDKGQLMTFVEAFRAWHAVHGTLPVKVTVLLEGEEESGSPSLDSFLRTHRETLAADVCVVSDTGMWDIDTPAITYMLRGMVYVEATLHGPDHDLHSGMYGGAVVNPVNELSRILGELHDAEGTVQIPGFYDDVRELGPEESEQWSRLTFDETTFLAHAGLKTPVGETGRSTLQRIWSRPCCDVNGIYGGYTGDGAKTIIPAQATTKVSCRLVPDQDAEKTYDNIVRFFEQRTPPDCRWTIKSHGASPAVRVPTDSPYLQAALQALAATYGRQPVLMGCGGSIPVVGSIQRLLGFDSLLVGFSLDDDRVHSPNEKFELRCFQMGMRSHAAMLNTFSALARTQSQASASG